MVGCMWLCSCEHSTHGILARAQAGDAQSQYEYGRRLLTGQKSPRSPQLAWGWFQAAAQQGHAKAQAAMGACCQLGLGLPQEEKEALSWYNKAAAQGEEHALAALLEHADKQGSVVAAKQTLQQLLDDENPVAELYMGTLLLQKAKNQQNINQAVDYLRYAALGGNGDAAFLLAVCYMEGCGVPSSTELALGWFDMAVELESEIALQVLQQISPADTDIPPTCSTF